MDRLGEAVKEQYGPRIKRMIGGAFPKKKSRRR